MILKAVAFLLSVMSLPAIPVFIGTSTGGDSGSKGIYLADFDPGTGKLTEPKLALKYQNPGFLALHPAKPVLLAVGAPDKPFPDGTSSVAAFSIAKDHSLKFLGEASCGGKGACHLAVDATGRTVAVACYGDGRVSTVRLDENGVPGNAVSVVAGEGSGPNKMRQEGPHAHGVWFDKASSRLFAPDLGLDKVLVYPFDPATSKLGEALPPLETARGAGPRHLAISGDGKHVYVINELDNTVLAASLEKGGLKPLAVIPTLPDGYTADSFTAEIEISPDDRFVYASNRGHDSIVVFQRDGKSGALTLIQHAPCGGKTPRHFKIAPGGKWLLCAHQNSNTISVLPLDADSGKLGPPACTVSSPSPICLVFGR